MESLAKRRHDQASSREEDGFGVQPRRVANLAMVPNLRQSSTSLCRSRRPRCLFSSCEKQEKLSSWIPDNIKKKECIYFVESSKLSDAGKVVCECGYPREKHLEEATWPHTFQGQEWDPKKHVREMPTDAFGDIVFTGLGQKAGKYIRLSQDTPSSLIYQLMTQQWGLDAPNLLISVTGGAKDFNMKPRLKSVFRRGLLKVAKTSGAWVITGGSHTGVMKQVGEAMRQLSGSFCEREVVTIGIATWGALHNRESLIHPMGGFPAEYIMDEGGQGNLTCLDSNHSHFILVDDGTHGRYGVEIPLRTNLEKFISQQTKERGGVAIKIPIVCVVLEGGPGTLNTIYNAITNGTPCVVVEGSGRVADVIAQVAGLPISEITISLIQQKLSMFFQGMFETFTESKIVEWTKKIQDIVRRRQLLTVFREGKDGQQDVDVAILQALLKASRSLDHFGHENWDHQLKLAVAWNRVDIAQSEIFTDERQWKPSELYPMMVAALITNKPEFVKLFLENGVQLKEFVSQATLVYLYQNLEPTCLFHCKLDKVLAGEPERLDPSVLLQHVAQVLRELLGDSTQPLYSRPRSSNRQRLLPVPSVKISVQRVSRQSLYKRSSGQATFTIDPVRDLLIWAIVQNRRELAEIIWAQSQDCIAAALACSKILKELSKEEEDTDSLEEMLALADEYEQRAIGVFTECYRKDEERAQKLLVRVSEAWGRTTCLQLALEAKDMKFVSHGGIQAYLTKVWWGQLGVDNGLWRVVLCMSFFPLLYTGLISFRNRRQQAEGGLARVCAFFSAPVVVFHMNILSYFAFLCLFAYVLMVDFQPQPSGCECLIYVWLFSLVCEELRQLFYDPDGSGLRKAVLVYFSDFWNKLDMCAILLFIAGLTCRLVPSLLYTGRIILSLDFTMFCLRLMHIFTISKTLGPKIIIVRRMMKDVFFFLFLLAVWVVSFGVAKQAILIHNERRVEWIFRGAIYHSYLTIFGQLPTYIDGVNFRPDQCSPNGTDPYKPKCPEIDQARQEPVFPEWLTVLLLCLYLLFANILLLNLLIAMFNYTFQQVQERTDQIWKFQRHDLIEEYQGRPPAPPPFILLSHLHLFIKRVVLKIPAKRHKQFKNKLEKNEEAALLSWEIYLKENYLQEQQLQQKQRPEQKIQDVSDKADAMVRLLETARLKQLGAVEQRLASLEEQVAQTATALHWIVKALRDSGFGSDEGVPTLAPQKASVGRDPELDSGSKAEDPGDAYHVNARHLLYPSCSVLRFPVPNEKVPWETEFLVYNPPFYTADRKDKDLVDPVGDALEPLSRISYNAVDGPLDRRSFHGVYTVRDRLPLNPMGRTGLHGRGDLSYFGPNHTLQPVITRWRRSLDGAICRKNVKKMLEVLVVKHGPSEHWMLPGGSREPGEMLPRKLKQVLRREFWSSFESLLTQGMEVYKGYMDDPRNTDNAWIETVAVSIHFPDQSDVELKRLNSHLHSCDEGMAIRWQVVDERIPLYDNHKVILQKVAALFGAYY